MKKNKISIVQISRLVIQIMFFVILPSLYINTFAGIKQIYIALIKHNAAASQLVPQLVEVAIIIPFTIIVGRFFCGWMCAFGALGDFIYKISNKVFKTKFVVNEAVDEKLKYFKYVLLAFLIFAICTFNITAFSTFSPWDVFGMVSIVGKVPDLKYVALNLTVGFIIFIAIGIASMFVERFFCRYLCPLGAVFAIISKLKIGKIKKERTNCGKCRICTNSCAMGIPLYKYDAVTSGECINCMKCIDACPRKNVTFNVSGDDVRPLVTGAAAVTIMTGLYYAGNLGVSAAGLNDVKVVAQSSSNISSDSVENSESEAETTMQDSSQSSSQSSTASSKSTNSKYKDGTYKGSGTGFRGHTTTVSVVVKNGRISDVTTLSYGDDEKFYRRASSTVINEIIDEQSTAVDAVSGATFSSRGIMEAVENALSKAE